MLPALVGAKTTVNVQVAAGPRAAEQEFAVMGNSPNALFLTKVSVPVAVPPVFLTVTIWGAAVLFTRMLAPKSSEAGVAVRRAGDTPVPVRSLATGLPLVPVTVRVAVFAPTVAGLSAMERVQVPVLATKEVPVQVSFVIRNSPLDRATARLPDAVSPLLVTVNTVAAPVVAIWTEPRSPAVGAMLSVLAEKVVPLRLTETVDAPAPVSVTVRVAVSAAAPTAVGLNTTETVQPASGARTKQALVAMKSSLLTPVTATASVLVATSPVLAMPNVMGVLG